MIHFSCSNCTAPLADIKITHPDDTIVWEMYAECPHCGDKSYVKEVKGLFSLVNEESTQQYTIVENFNMDVSPIVLQTVKVSDYVS